MVESRLDAGTREIVEAAAAVYRSGFEDGFVGLVVHGSAVVGDAIPGCSDIDFQLMLTADAFGPDGVPPFEVALDVHRGLARIDLGPYAYLQCYAYSSDPDSGPRPGPLVPDAFEVVAGEPVFPTYDADGLLRSSRAAIERLPNALAGKAKGLIQAGQERFERQIRYTATEAWPAIRAALCFAGCDPLLAWRVPKRQAIELLAERAPEPGRLAAEYHRTLVAYFEFDHEVETGLNSLRIAADLFGAVLALAKVRSLSAG